MCECNLYENFAESLTRYHDQHRIFFLYSKASAFKYQEQSGEPAVYAFRKLRNVPARQSEITLEFPDRLLWSSLMRAFDYGCLFLMLLQITTNNTV